jgi:hypothetical protein
MSHATPCPAKTFTWNLTQERVDSLAKLLYKLETMLDVASPGGPDAEQVACFINDLRAQCCISGGAADPFEDMPLSPQFDVSNAFDDRRSHAEELVK